MPQPKFKVGDIVRLTPSAYIPLEWQRHGLIHGALCVIAEISDPFDTGNVDFHIVPGTDGVHTPFYKNYRPWMRYGEIELEPYLMAVRTRRHK